jgi:uncharacterized Zn finger protein (UPF0148 family)
MIQKLNLLLDQGYKLTTSNCPACKTPLMSHPEGQLICGKCDTVEHSPSHERSHERALERAPEPSHVEPSKLMSEKLLQGWTMLARNCEGLFLTRLPHPPHEE